MKNVFILCVFLIIAIAMLSTMGYFILHYTELSYINNAMADLLGAIFGVIIGIPTGLWINRKQSIIQEKRDSEILLKKESQYLSNIFTRIKSELSTNLLLVKSLDNAIGYAFNRERNDSWDWSIEIVNSFSFIAFYDYDRSGLERITLNQTSNAIHKAYTNLQNLLHDVRLTAIEFNYYRTVKYNTYNQDPKRDNIYSSRNGTVSSIEETMKIINTDPIMKIYSNK